MKTLTKKQVYEKFIKNRYAAQHPKWVLELPKQFVEKGYAKPHGDALEFIHEPSPKQIMTMLQENHALLEFSAFKNRFYPMGHTIGLKIKRSLAIGLLATILALCVFFLAKPAFAEDKPIELNLEGLTCLVMIDPAPPGMSTTMRILKCRKPIKK